MGDKSFENRLSGQPKGSFADIMAIVPYEFLLEFDIPNNRCRVLRRVEGKYRAPSMLTTLDGLWDYVAQEMVHPEDCERLHEAVKINGLIERMRASSTPGIISVDVRYRLLSGEYNWMRQVEVHGPLLGLSENIVYCYMFDIDTHRTLDRIAPFSAQKTRRDSLTGLLTDDDLFPLARARMFHAQGKWCVIAIDIERFRLFAEWYGRASADKLLIDIANLLKRIEQDTGGMAGYHGGDDFWLVIPYEQRLVDSIYDELATLIASHTNAVGFMPVFGVCMTGDMQEDISDIFNHAAMAAEQIKGDLHNRIHIYDPAAYRRAADEYKLLADFQRAMENHEIYFALQPQCRISTQQVVGAESLARWRTPDGGMVSPARFVPVLEKYGLVTNLDRYIWESVCDWLRRWIDAGHTPVPISINISRIDILTIDVPSTLNTLLTRYRLPARLIKAEVTESAYVDDAVMVRNTVRRLQAMGILVMMDDFGSGYSSLNMLGSLKVDVIKLDAQFLRINPQNERQGISILESIINMTKTLRLPIVVEGVETREQMDFLSDLGCRYIQGYYFHPPMSVSDFEAMILDEDNLDLNGFEFKAATQIHPREILDENIFSDAMLNNILGPVAIYQWKGNDVNIVRYNQQFYKMVRVSLAEMNERTQTMQKYIYTDDVPKLYQMLSDAKNDHLNGASGVLRVYRPDQSLCWISVRLYFLSDDDAGSRFYAACRDVTESQFLNAEVPGGYHRCSVDDGFVLRHVSQSFLDMVGYTEEELQHYFDNRLINMIHPDDVQATLDWAQRARAGQQMKPLTFRIRHSDGHYLHVTSHSTLMQYAGALCFMGMITDISETMRMRNNMDLLCRFSSDCFIFLRHSGNSWRYEVFVYGMADRFGMDRDAFERALNDRSFFERVNPDDRERLRQTSMTCFSQHGNIEFVTTITLPDGRPVPLHVKGDYVDDPTLDVAYIFIMRAV